MGIRKCLVVDTTNLDYLSTSYKSTKLHKPDNRPANSHDLPRVSLLTFLTTSWQLPVSRFFGGNIILKWNVNVVSFPTRTPDENKSKRHDVLQCWPVWLLKDSPEVRWWLCSLLLSAWVFHYAAKWVIRKMLLKAHTTGTTWVTSANWCTVLHYPTTWP